MTKHFPITRVSILALAAALAASGAAWGATWYPGYYCAALPGISNAYMQSIGEAASPQGWSLLPNGTVIGDSSDVQPGSVNGMPPGFPYQEGLVWTVNGSTATMTDLGNIEGLAANGASTDSANAMFGDSQGRYAASIDDVGPIGLWNGTTFTSLASRNSNLQWGGTLLGQSANGLLVGQSDSGAGWAFDLNTNNYYSFGPTWTLPLGVNSNGSVVGQDGGGTKAFIWNEATQTYSVLAGMGYAIGVSNNNQYVVGQNQSGQAAVYSPSGSQLAAYWSGEATAVNNSGIVGGDTATAVTPLDYYNQTVKYNGVAEAYFPGHGVVPLNDYAPAGVSFNFVQAINDSGQILVWSGGIGAYMFGNLNGGCTSYVLTPGLPGDANLDGKVDINDLTIVLAHYNQTGMTWAQGEFTGSGTVDINDLTIVLAHYNNSLGTSAGLAAVPEPSSLALLGVLTAGLVGCAWRKRRIGA